MPTAVRACVWAHTRAYKSYNASLPIPMKPLRINNSISSHSSPASAPKCLNGLGLQRVQVQKKKNYEYPHE
jgi:hypothetical protein